MFIWYVYFTDYKFVEICTEMIERDVEWTILGLFLVVMKFTERRGPERGLEWPITLPG